MYTSNLYSVYLILGYLLTDVSKNHREEYSAQSPITAGNVHLSCYESKKT